MCDEDGRAFPSARLDGLPYGRLGVDVEVARRFIQKEEAWVSD